MRMHALFGIIMALLLVSPIFAAEDSSLGGSIDNAHAKVARGNLEKFEISVFSLKNQTLEVKASAGKVDDLQINIIPSTLTLQGGLTQTPTNGEKWMIIDGDKYARAYPIIVYVRVPQQVSQSRYSIPITISSAVSDSSASGNTVVQKVVQAIQYNIEIDVPGASAGDEVDELAETLSDQASIDETPAYNIPVFGQIREQMSNFLGSNEKSNPILKNNTPSSSPEKSSSEDGGIPSGYLILNTDGTGSINYLLVLGALALIGLIIYLIKK